MNNDFPGINSEVLVVYFSIRKVFTLTFNEHPTMSTSPIKSWNRPLRIINDLQTLRFEAVVHLQERYNNDARCQFYCSGRVR